ncbi:MAG: DNA translocase FtsK [Bacteroidales bacterium]|nr:DNA translocase FtsK [Bacteroidales bacterium]
MNRYLKYTPEQMEEHLSGYLVNSWSYSGVQCFARNEKAFEMQYIYCERDRKSISSIAGSAYHEALKEFFSIWKPGVQPEFVALTAVAYGYLDEVPANDWKTTDKFPTAEAAKAEATSKVNNLLKYFCEEAGTYTDDIAEVLHVETRFEEWVTVNGVDIPLPLHAVIDLVARLKDGRVVIIDHKSKSKYTDGDEVALVHGQQAMTYVEAYETANPTEEVSEVWFVEAKESKNKDGSAQLRKHVISIDRNSRMLYEALLYEPLKRMCEAVSNPDYVYMINTSDNFIDKAVLYDFWARTMIAEVDDFPTVPDSKKELIRKRTAKIKDSSRININPKIITKFRTEAASFIRIDYSNCDMTKQEKIEHVLRSHNINVQVAHTIDGFCCDTYLLDVAPGVTIVSIFSHRMDIAYALDVPQVRIAGYLMMYNNRSYVAIEVNKKRERTLLWSPEYLEGHKIPLGMDNLGRTIVWDLDNHSTPHMLVCGSTGSGKSVELISILAYAQEAGIDDIVIFDPKYEFASLDCGNASVFSDIEDLERVMEQLVNEMNGRIKAKTRKLTLVIFDEFADAMDQSRTAKELQGKKTLMENLKMLLQKGRSCGMRFCVATQRASTKVITGDIKVNLPVQVCFKVPKAVDSKVVLDDEGAQTLQKYGDGLIKSPEYQDGLVRFQAFYKP